MSKKTILENNPDLTKRLRRNNNLPIYKEYNPKKLQNLPECPNGSSNRNDSKEHEIKFETDYLDQTELKKHESSSKLNNIKNNNIYLINNKKIFRDPSKNNKDLESNLKESTSNKSKQLEVFSEDQDSEGHANIKIKNEESYEDACPKIPLISTDFKQKENEVNNNINHIPKSLNKINDIYSCEPSFKDEKSSINNINRKNYEINNNQQQKIIYFNIPDNFLIDCHLIEINVKNIEKIKNHNYPTNLIDLNEAQIFINNLCNNIIYEHNEDLNNLNYFNEEYIELRKIKNKEKKILLQKKTKKSLDNKKLKNLLGKKTNIIKNNKEKKCEFNNGKNGRIKSLYLNQIQINKYSLKNFPFYPTLNNIKIIETECLMNLIEKNSFIRINKNSQFINNQRNLKYIKNKLFEIIYQHKNEEIQYIIHIKGYHILYFIFYYYYQIQQNIIFLNKIYYYYYSNEKIREVIKHLLILIKKCNKFVKKISK